MQTLARKLNLIALALGVALTAPGCATDWFSSSSSDYVAGELSQDVENLPDPNAPPAPPKRSTIVSPPSATFKESPDRLLLQANAYFEQGKFHDSSRLYRKYLATPEAAAAPPTVLGQAHHRLAVVARKKMSFAEAKREFETALRYEPQNQLYRFDLGKSAFDGADYATADAAFSALIAQNPNYPQAQYYYGLTLLEGTRRAEAFAPLTKAVGELEAAALLTNKYYELGEMANAATWEAQTTQIAARLGRPVPAFPNKSACVATTVQPQSPAVAQSAPVAQPQETTQAPVVAQSAPIAQPQETAQAPVVAQSAPVAQPQETAQAPVVAQSAPVAQPQETAQSLAVAQSAPVAQPQETAQAPVVAQSAPGAQSQETAQSPAAAQSAPVAQPQETTQAPVVAQSAPGAQPQETAQAPVVAQSAPVVQPQETAQSPAVAQSAPVAQPQETAQAPAVAQSAPIAQPQETAQAPAVAQLQGPSAFVATVAPAPSAEIASNVAPLADATLKTAADADADADVEPQPLAVATSEESTRQDDAQTSIPPTTLAQNDAPVVAAPVSPNAEDAQRLAANIGRRNPGLFAAPSSVAVAPNAASNGFRPGSISTTAPLTAQNVPVDQTTQETQIAQNVSANQAAQETQIAQNVSANQAAQETQIAQNVSANQAAQETQIAQNVSVDQATQETQIAQNVPANQTTQETQIAQNVPANQTTQETQIAQNVSANQAAQETQIAQNVPVDQTTQETQIAQNAPVIGPRLPKPSSFDVEAGFRRVESFDELENCVAEYFAPVAPIYEIAPSPFQVAEAEELYAVAPSPSDLAVDEEEEFDENDDFAFASSGTPQTPVPAAPATIGGFGSYQAPTFDASPLVPVQPIAQTAPTTQAPQNSFASQYAPTAQAPQFAQNAPTFALQTAPTTQAPQIPFASQYAPTTQTTQFAQVPQNAPTVALQYAAPNAAPRRPSTPEERLQAAVAAGAEVREISPEEYRRAVSVGLNGQARPR